MLGTNINFPIVKYNFNNLNQVSGDYWGGPPPPPEIAGGRGGPPPVVSRNLGQIVKMVFYNGFCNFTWFMLVFWRFLLGSCTKTNFYLVKLGFNMEVVGFAEFLQRFALVLPIYIGFA